MPAEAIQFPLRGVAGALLRARLVTSTLALIRHASRMTPPSWTFPKSPLRSCCDSRQAHCRSPLPRRARRSIRGRALHTTFPHEIRFQSIAEPASARRDLARRHAEGPEQPGFRARSGDDRARRRHYGNGAHAAAREQPWRTRKLAQINEARLQLAGRESAHRKCIAKYVPRARSWLRALMLRTSLASPAVRRCIRSVRRCCRGASRGQTCEIFATLGIFLREVTVQH